jgi:hypothetical protein
MRIARGMFRVWVALSVLWAVPLTVVGIYQTGLTLRERPAMQRAEEQWKEHPHGLSYEEVKSFEESELIGRESNPWHVAGYWSLAAFAPPAALLMLGFVCMYGGGWVVRGFKS